MPEPMGVVVLSYLLNEPTKAGFEAQRAHFRYTDGIRTWVEACSWLFHTYATDSAISRVISELRDVR